MIERLERIAGDVIDPEPALSTARLQQEQAIATMRPIKGDDVAVEVVDLQVAPLPAARLPDQWPVKAAPV